MTSPLISIIIVVYNGERTLEKALQSVISQTYLHKEIIIVDGGSQDRTLPIIEQYKKHITTCVSEKDRGIYDAMNKGIGLAKGEWLYFLGSDDSFTNNNVLELVSRSLLDPTLRLVYGNVVIQPGNKIYDGPFNLEKLLIKNISHQAIFYNQEVFKTIGNYQIKYRTHADWDLNLRWFLSREVTCKYVNISIAHFALGGASSFHDVLFLQESLLPAKLNFLQINGTRILSSILVYDDHWRLIRNAGIKSPQELVKAKDGIILPPVIANMIRTQAKIPTALLKNGFVSKTIMFIHYLFNFNKLKR